MIPLDYCIVIGCSSGGLSAMQRLFKHWPTTLCAAVAVAQHIDPGNQGLAYLFQREAPWPVLEAEDKQPFLAQHIYFANANYHLSIGRDNLVSLSDDAKVCFSRPSIDVLFESAARTFSRHCIAILLTGANADGTQGCQQVKAMGGYTIAQDPNEAEASNMPQSAIDAGVIDTISYLSDISSHLLAYSNKKTYG